MVPGQESGDARSKAFPGPERAFMELQGHNREVDRGHGPGQNPAGLREVGRTPSTAKHERGGGQLHEVVKVGVGVENGPHFRNGGG
ncbi:hypothetical protein D3C73_1049450 [compost metagenome]